jgi:hypothetical protein
MNEKHDAGLERLDTWDVDKAEVKQPVKPSRVVFSVAFHQDEFERVSKHALLLGKKTSQFIREAAIEKTLQESDPVLFLISSFSLDASWFADPQPITMVSGNQIEHPEDIITITQ